MQSQIVAKAHLYASLHIVPKIFVLPTISKWTSWSTTSLMCAPVPNKTLIGIAWEIACCCNKLPISNSIVQRTSTYCSHVSTSSTKHKHDMIYSHPENELSPPSSLPLYHQPTPPQVLPYTSPPPKQPRHYPHSPLPPATPPPSLHSQPNTPPYSQHTHPHSVTEPNHPQKAPIWHIVPSSHAMPNQIVLDWMASVYTSPLNQSRAFLVPHSSNRCPAKHRIWPPFPMPARLEMRRSILLRRVGLPVVRWVPIRSFLTCSRLMWRPIRWWPGVSSPFCLRWDSMRFLGRRGGFWSLCESREWRLWRLRWRGPCRKLPRFGRRGFGVWVAQRIGGVFGEWRWFLLRRWSRGGLETGDECGGRGRPGEHERE